MVGRDGQMSIDTSDNLFYQFTVCDFTMKHSGKAAEIKQIWHSDKICFYHMDKSNVSINIIQISHLFI